MRGCANAWLLHHAPFVWPVAAKQWAQRNREGFWSRGFWFAGYREFAHGRSDGLFEDVESGPVLAGYGTSARAFGLGAARSVGAYAEARVIGLQAIAASLPLPNGRLLLPRLLSDASDAPLLGEAALLYNLSQPTAPGFGQVPGARPSLGVPAIVWLVLLLQLGLGSAGVLAGLRRLRAAWTSRSGS